MLYLGVFGVLLGVFACFSVFRAHFFESFIIFTEKKYFSLKKKYFFVQALWACVVCVLWGCGLLVTTSVTGAAPQTPHVLQAAAAFLSNPQPRGFIPPGCTG